MVDELTLTDFLLARIAEEEAIAHKAIEWRNEIKFANPPTVPDMEMQPWEDTGIPAVLVGPERVLADCRARRKVVQEIETMFVLTGATPGGAARLAMNSTLRTILCYLAVPYRQHADYDDPWRP